MTAISSPHTGREIASLPNGFLDSGGHGAKTIVARLMAVAVVKILETIEIQKQKGQLFVAAPGPTPLALER